MLGLKEIIRVQHHHAHVVSCMAENHVSGKVIGIAMDGTGYGEDGHIWGGEFLVADETGFKRAARLRYIPLPGGEAAIKQPWRTAVGLIWEFYRDKFSDVISLLGIVPDCFSVDSIEKILDAKVNSPLCSSLGRLFDGVASIIGLRRHVGFEGQAAMDLEAVAKRGSGDILPYELVTEGGVTVVDPSPLVKAIIEGKLMGADMSQLASSFHITLVNILVDVAKRIRDVTGIDRAALSGGCFQNRILLEGCTHELEKEGFEVFTHQRVPANDGGISLGQAVIAGMRKKKELEERL
jgi:hydrogenase maturation protein HypF